MRNLISAAEEEEEEDEEDNNNNKSSTIHSLSIYIVSLAQE